MLVGEAIDHFRVAGVHFQSHPVFDKAGDVGVQKNAGLDHFVRRFVICTQESSFRTMAKKWGWGRCWAPQPSVPAA